MFTLFWDVKQRSVVEPTFQDNLSVPSSRVFLDFLNLEDGTDRLPQNLGTELLLNPV
jgi:hypothetical protein